MTIWTTWTVSATTVTVIEEELARAFPVLFDGERTSNRRLYDSFDWRLYTAGYMLWGSGREWVLQGLDPETSKVQGTGPVPGKRLFSWDFAASELKDRLEPILQKRAVLPLAAVQSKTRSLRVLNKDEKTVVLVCLEQLHTEKTENTRSLVHLGEVRGYGKELRRVRTCLHKKLVGEPVQDIPAFTLALDAVGRQPGDYSSTFVLELNAEQSAREAMVAIYLELLKTLRDNLDGVCRDLDSEFLHDLRVAVRRTRSGQALSKGVLPGEVVARFREEFAWVSSITGPTRDLDVCLLSEKEYAKRLPVVLQPGLKTFFEDVRQRRARVKAAMVRALKTPRFAQLLDDWEAVLTGERMAQSACADIPVLDLARKVIWKRYRRVLRDGLAITADTPDAELHRLRIQGKKLRYAIEFFSSLFPQKGVEQAIRRLKVLQKNLGDFNDLSVQQEMLTAYLAQLDPGSRTRLMLGAAVGGLMSSLNSQQLQVRRNFANTFADFSGEQTTTLFHRLFSNARSL
ncbi:MAG: hypothetical protein CSA34_01300 [Desulfobulbus propionicus]|nr:MAG: hypothetical protein CSA34_01300 [Desulfobulbus propionicus]